MENLQRLDWKGFDANLSRWEDGNLLPGNDSRGRCDHGFEVSNAQACHGDGSQGSKSALVLFHDKGGYLSL